MTSVAHAADQTDQTDLPKLAFPDARAELMSLTAPKALAAWLTREREALQANWSSERGGRAWMHEHSSLLDLMIRRLFALSRERVSGEAGADGSGGPAGEGIAILAVGGYGQRLCAPHSDLDLTFLSERDNDPPVLREMFRLVMDVLLSGAKIKVGYAYRTLNDIAGDTLDHQTQTALLDARLITGDRALFEKFESTFPARLAVADFLFRKEAERERVRARCGGSPYVVEPNVKEGVGGVRDIQTAAWMGRVRFDKSGESLWRDLVRRRVLTREDWEALSASRELLLTVRCGLHVLAGERRDVLSVGRQEEISSRLGYTDSADGTPGVEKFMRRWYGAAADVERISNKVMARCLDAPLPLGHDTGLSSVRRTVAITDPSRAESDPLWPITALEACQEHGLELAAATDEAIARHIAEGGFGPPNSDTVRAAAARFVVLLTAPGDPVGTLKRMRRTNLLGVLLPELSDCMRLIPYDPAHAHTIGEHSLLVLDNLIRLRDTPDNAVDPASVNYKNVLSALLSPLPLFLAALLHDIGKQWPLRISGERAGHEVTGGDRISAISARLGCTEQVAQQTEFLVREHLLLARVSRLRDLSLPSTIREVLRQVSGDSERLRMLYLLTWADTNSVGPGIWTPMSARLLDELFVRADEAITTGNERDDVSSGDDPARLAGFRQRLQRQIAVALHDGPTLIAPPEQAQAHIAAMPAAYLLNTPPETMALHLDMIARMQQGDAAVVVDMRHAATSGPASMETGMTVVTRDAPGLFAKITGALLACDIRLHRAQAFTRPSGEDGVQDIVIDTLAVDYRGHPLGPEKRRAVEEALRLVLSGEEAVAALITRRRGTTAGAEELPAIRTLQVDETIAPGFTLVDVETRDETGVTYRLAACFGRHGWNIHAARVSTWGGNAHIAFYLTDGAGHALNAAAVRDRLSETLTIPPPNGQKTRET